MSDDVLGLVDRCLVGEQAAIGEFVERFQPRLFGLCYRLLSHRQDAEDMTQESLVRALRGLGGWDRSREIMPWLLAIAGNRCRSYLALRRRRPSISPLVELAVDTATGDESARNLGEELRLALETVREEYRQAFLLFHEQELSYAEIAAAMDCPVGTIKTWVHRARRELIERLRQREVLAEAPHVVRAV